MGLIVDENDFADGRYRLSIGTYDKLLTACIASYEEPFLRKLLGTTLFNLFEADLNGSGVPGTQKYLTIFNAIHEQDGSCEHHSEGMVELVKAEIWFRFMCEVNIKRTTSGNVKNKADISSPADNSATFICNNYNDAMEWWNTIQWKIYNNATDYPSFNGQDFDIASFV